jgi:hypothetical protein
MISMIHGHRSSLIDGLVEIVGREFGGRFWTVSAVPVAGVGRALASGSSALAKNIAAAR